MLVQPNNSTVISSSKHYCCWLLSR